VKFSNLFVLAVV